MHHLRSELIMIVSGLDKKMRNIMLLHRGTIIISLTKATLCNNSCLFFSEKGLQTKLALMFCLEEISGVTVELILGVNILFSFIQKMKFTYVCTYMLMYHIILKGCEGFFCLYLLNIGVTDQRPKLNKKLCIFYTCILTGIQASC